MKDDPFPLTLNLPATFASDHCERDLPCGIVLREGNRFWKVKVNRSELDEWESDADFYADRIGFDPDFDHNITRSARSTLERIKKVKEVYGLTQ